jgi:chitinase
LSQLWRGCNATFNNAPPLIRVADTTVSEADPFAQLAVSLSAPSAQTVTVTYGTGNGTAVSYRDYLGSSGTLTFAPGETTKTVRVALLADTASENSEVFFLSLRSPTNAQLGRTDASITLTDNDSGGGTPPKVTASSLFTKGQNYELALKDYGGSPHGFSNAIPAGVANG